VVVLQWWWRCYFGGSVERGVRLAVVDLESAVWWWICVVVVFVWWWLWSGGREHRKRRSCFCCCLRGGCVVARGVWWWLMGWSVGFIGFRGVWCWFLVRINGGFLVVNGSFWWWWRWWWWLCFLWVFFYEFVVGGVFKYTDVRWCGLFKVRLHEFLVGLMVILERFFNGLAQDLFLLLRRRLNFGFWRWLLGLLFSF